MMDDSQEGWQCHVILHPDILPKEAKYLWLAILSLRVIQWSEDMSPLSEARYTFSHNYLDLQIFSEMFSLSIKMKIF